MYLSTASMTVNQTEAKRAIWAKMVVTWTKAVTKSSSLTWQSGTWSMRTCRVRISRMTRSATAMAVR